MSNKIQAPDSPKKSNAQRVINYWGRPLGFGVIVLGLSYGIPKLLDSTEYAKKRDAEQKAQIEKSQTERSLAVEKILNQLEKPGCTTKIHKSGEFLSVINATRACVSDGVTEYDILECKIHEKDIHGDHLCVRDN